MAISSGIPAGDGLLMLLGDWWGLAIQHVEQAGRWPRCCIAHTSRVQAKP